MITPLKKTPLHDLQNRPILFDANIFMVGISERATDKKYSFECFTDIYIHDEVYKELDNDARAFVDAYKGKNVTIAAEGGLYGTDPKYTTILNRIAEHELVRYVRGRSKDRGRCTVWPMPHIVI